MTSTANPPVFFSIAAVRHEPLLALGKFIPQIQDALRRQGFSGPVLQEEHVEENVRRQNIYTIFTPDRTAAFTFNDEGIFSYHTSAYTTRSEMFSAFRMGLTILHEQLELKNLIRVGIRMLDLIRPSDTDSDLHRYVNQSLLGFSGIGCSKHWTSGLGTIEQHLYDEDAEVIARMAVLPDSFGIHSDLISAVKGHSLPPTLSSKPGEMHCILDIDSGTRIEPDSNGVNSRQFDIESVMTELTTHKDRVSKLFRNAVTPWALKNWGL